MEVPLVFVVPGHHRVVSWPLAPASSGSRGWGRVLGCSVVMGQRGGVAAANEINVSTTLRAGARSGGGGWLSLLVRFRSS
jgi:hypothetical protein